MFWQNWDDHAQLTFVQTHLAELLELLSDPGELSSSHQVLRDGTLSSDALQALSVLLEGTVSRGRTIHPLYRLLSRAPLQSVAGYSKVSRSYSLQKLQSWLHQALTLNPFGMSTCLRSGKKLAWALQGKKCFSFVPFLAQPLSHNLFTIGILKCTSLFLIKRTVHLQNSLCFSGRCYEEGQDSEEHTHGPSRQQGGADVPGIQTDSG